MGNQLPNWCVKDSQPIAEKILKLHGLKITAENISDALEVSLEEVLQVLASSNESEWAKRLIEKFDKKSRRFRCTLSRNLMKSPVIAPDGQLYEQNILVASLQSEKPRFPLAKVNPASYLIEDIRSLAESTLKKLPFILEQQIIPDRVAFIAAECLSVLDLENVLDLFLNVLATDKEEYLQKLLSKLSELVPREVMWELLVQSSTKEKLQISSILMIRQILQNKNHSGLDEEFDQLLNILSQTELKAETLKHLDELIEDLTNNQLWSVIGALISKKRDGIMQRKLNELKTEAIKRVLIKGNEDLSKKYNDHKKLLKLADGLNAQGIEAYHEGSYAQAEEMLIKCLRIREQVLSPKHPDLAHIYSNLGMIYHSQRSYAQAEEMLIKCLRIREEVLPPKHPDLATIYNNLGLMYDSKGSYAQAKELYIKCLRIHEEVLPKHPNLAHIYNNLGSLYFRQDSYSQAEEMYLKCLRLREEVLPPKHPDLAFIYRNFGVLCCSQDSYAQAEGLYIKCLRIWEEVLPPLHPNLALIYNDLGSVYKKRGSYAQAEEMLIKCLRIWEKVLQPKHLNLATIYENLGLLYDSQGSYAQAEEMLIKCLRIREDVLSPKHPGYQYISKMLKALQAKRTGSIF